MLDQLELLKLVSRLFNIAKLTSEEGESKRQDHQTLVTSVENIC